MATYIRYAHKARKLVIDLGVARDNVYLEGPVTAVTILDKPAGNFTLHFRFYDGTTLDLDQDEVLEGAAFQWDIQELRLTNPAQTGLTLKLLIDIQVLRK